MEAGPAARLAATLEAVGARLVHLDPFCAVIDKPSGLPSQAGRDGAPGLVERVRSAGLPGAALHHRLDQPASGLLILALDPLAHPGLARAFRERIATRVYRAVLSAPVADATWEAPLDGRPARTHVTPVGAGSGYTAVEVRLETGRTHQIRRHAAMAGAPILGDRRYGGEVGRGWPRLALHACRLGLPHPVTDRPMAFTSELPPDLEGLWRLAGGSTG